MLLLRSKSVKSQALREEFNVSNKDGSFFSRFMYGVTASLENQGKLLKTLTEIKENEDEVHKVPGAISDYLKGVSKTLDSYEPDK